ncbi:MAG: hypothetical protein H6833_00210 [Planctomycetes bacterium]|nr:hypothetical protein [Planctomycetota bacterium]
MLWIRTVTLLMTLLASATLHAQWYGGDLKNKTTPGRPEIKISGEGDLRGGGKGVREVKPGESADGVGVIDCDMAICVWRYGEGAKDYKFYTKRIHNLQTCTVRDKKPGTEPSGWDTCTDGNDMSDEDFAKYKAKYWDFSDGGIFMSRDTMPKSSRSTRSQQPTDIVVTA